MLTRHLTVALASVGLDPYRGFYHAPRYGRPALALDVMEPFRAVIADSVVLSARSGRTTSSSRSLGVGPFRADFDAGDEPKANDVGQTCA